MTIGDKMTPEQAHVKYIEYQMIRDSLIHEVTIAIKLRYKKTLDKYWKIYADSL